MRGISVNVKYMVLKRCIARKAAEQKNHAPGKDSTQLSLKKLFIVKD